MAAIPNSPRHRTLRLLAACWVSILAGANSFATDPATPTNHAGFRLHAEREFQARQTEHQNAPTNAAAAWQFARACFQRGDFSTNHAERAALAELGIAACRQWLQRDSNSAPARYFLGLNLGQLARTKTFGALAIVDEMEVQFQRARELDERLEHAGPDRSLGLLYREAPVLASVGSRTKARQHLRRAAELAPGFPPNRLNLLESYAGWGEKGEARLQLRRLEVILPVARTNFTGADWAAAWAEWEPRVAQARRTLAE